MLESLFKKFAGLATILKNISQRLLLYCTHTTRCYLSVYFIFSTYRSSHRRCSLKKGVLSNFAKGLHFIKKETLAQVFSCEIFENSKDMFSTEPAAEHFHTTASLLSLLLLLLSPMFAFRSNSNGFKEFESGISFSLSHFQRYCFLFPCLFCLFQFCFIFSCCC